MGKRKLLATLKADFARYPSIPEELYQYIEKVILTDTQEKFLPTLSGKGKEQTLQRVERLFIDSRRILNCDKKQIIKGLDFHPNDVQRGRIDALLAELRTVSWLDSQGFHDIQLLESAGKKQADMLATLSGSRFAVEVFCSTDAAYRWPDHPNPHLDLIQDFINEAIKKRPQLDATATDHNCDKRLLALVLDSEPARKRLDHSHHAANLQRIAEALGWGDRYHFALITGMGDAREGPDDTIYPNL